MPTKRKCRQCKKCSCGHMKKKGATTKTKKRGKTSRSSSRSCNFGNQERYVPGKYLNRSKSSRFGGLEVPSGMRSVSSYRSAGQYNRPFLQMPFGPPQPWLMEGPEAAASSSLPAPNSFGSNSLKDRYVNPSGYLSTWYGAPRTPPPSWDPLLLQGNNIFRQGINNPRLSQVML